MTTTTITATTAQALAWPSIEDQDARVAIAAEHDLFVTGDPSVAQDPRERSVVITGARASTAYGDRVAQDLAADLTEAGHVIWTGGAFGIDAAAIRGSLAAGGTPVILTACGAQAAAYPKAHADLFDRVITAGGAIVSLEDGTAAPTRTRFLQRGRVLGALAGAVIIVEAGIRSGALAVAAAAHRTGRPVYAVPGPITSMASAGNHDLIREGKARILTDATHLDRT